jgi:cytochrome c peroxidase
VTGADPHTVGTLKPPTSAYATLIPDFAILPGQFGGPFAGNFWNGRATGEAVRDLKVLGEPGDPLHVKYAEYLGAATDQAHASPFINPVEQGLPDKIAVCEHVNSAKYAPLYAIAYEEPISCAAGDIDITFGRFALAIGAFEFSGDVNQFASKRDIALANDADGNFPLDGFTEQENFGHDLFYGITSDLNPAPSKNAGCGAFCHRSGNNQGTSPQERYTGDGYFNIGVPRNVAIPGNPEPNEGVFFMTGDDGDKGAHKTPTPTAVAFGVTRCDPGVGLTEEDALANNCWPEPEFTGNIPFFILGSRNLTDEEEKAIVSYMKTFSDPVTKAPKPFDLKKFNQEIPF